MEHTLKRLAVIAVGATIGGAAAGWAISQPSIAGVINKVPQGYGPKIFVPVVVAAGVMLTTSFVKV